MTSQLRGRAKALLAFALIASLVVGGLGWVTAETLHLEAARSQSDFEKERSEQRAAWEKAQAEQQSSYEKELSAQLGLALWRLDSRVAPALAREDSRPYDNYGAFFAPALLYRTDGTPLRAGEVVEPSPLVNAELPDWMLLHFQTDAEQGWGSPQVLSQNLLRILQNPKVKPSLDNVTENRHRLLIDLAGSWGPESLLEEVEARCSQVKVRETTVQPAPQVPQTPPDQVQTVNPDATSNQQRPSAQTMQKNYNNEMDVYARDQLKERLLREAQTNKVQCMDLAIVLSNMKRNGEGWFAPPALRPVAGQKTEVKLSLMVPLWLSPKEREDRLIVARMVKVGDRQICQGIVLDWSRLQQVLAAEIRDLFPDARFVPMRAAVPPRPDRTMKWLPVELDPGVALTAPVTGELLAKSPPDLGDWTPLRIGLALAWVAALVALLAVGLGGWSLLALSERRIAFVSAVTHELRTPLTTLRLYLDMLTGGLVQGEEQKTEYLQTLHGETERLNRLVANVLDFSRLERQRPRLEKSSLPPVELLEQVSNDWQERCRSCEKKLVIENELPEEAQVTTDVKLARQVLGNLIDNACKYSRGADDPRVWLRAKREGKRLVLEVEDRGPGVPPRERRSIFRPFRRGNDADVTAGGVGLGLALARRWARLLGGRLVLGSPKEGTGACFRLELPGA